MKIKLFSQKTPEELQIEIAKKISRIRKNMKLTQKELSIKSGVSLGSIKRFERTGEISLKFLMMIAISIDISDEFEDLFTK